MQFKGPPECAQVKAAKEDLNLYINGVYIPSIIERRMTKELGKPLTVSSYSAQVRRMLRLAKCLHNKVNEIGRLTEADFYETNKAIFQLASILNQMQKPAGEGQRVEDNQ